MNTVSNAKTALREVSVVAELRIACTLYYKVLIRTGTCSVIMDVYYNDIADHILLAQG